MVAVELEVLAKKYDRFGWDRDMNTPAQDRLITDWMDALQDYPLSEVQQGCREWVRNNPRKMPNEGNIRGEIQKARAKQWEARKATMPREDSRTEPRVTAEAANEILARAGFEPKRFAK